MTRACAVIPAAGRGSRLGMDCPKILVPIDGERTIWSVLRGLLLPVVDHVHVVLSPAASSQFNELLKLDRERDRISTGIQSSPIGMGDAIFSAADSWRGFDSIAVVWGDQVNLSAATVKRLLDVPLAERAICLPLTSQPCPYVQYDVSGDRLMRVRQTREGDITEPNGFSDVGMFALSTTDLIGEWERYVVSCATGTRTGELNFLPFLVYLSRDRGWPVRTFIVDDPDEARGVNTPEDLNFTRRRLSMALEHAIA